MAALEAMGKRHEAPTYRSRESFHRHFFWRAALKAENVATAVQTVRPFAVDLCSGVRTAGRLDPAKLTEFVEAVTKRRRSESN